jgi:hypothetical protein
MSLTPEESTFAVRRSIHVNAAPERVWGEFSSFARMNAWWGIVTGEPQAGTSNGQWLEVYEPQRGGRIRMAVNWDGPPRLAGKRSQTSRPGTPSIQISAARLQSLVCPPSLV